MPTRRHIVSKVRLILFLRGFGLPSPRILVHVFVADVEQQKSRFLPGTLVIVTSYFFSMYVPFIIFAIIFYHYLLIVVETLIRGHKAGSSPSSPLLSLSCIFIAGSFQPFHPWGSSTDWHQIAPACPRLLLIIIGALSNWYRFLYIFCHIYW